MEYFIVKTSIDLYGDIKIFVEIPSKFVLPSTKYKYDLKKRSIAMQIIKAYFMSKEILNKVKENAELDFKDRYGEEINISKLEIENVRLNDNNVIIIYKAKLKGREKKKYDIKL